MFPEGRIWKEGCSVVDIVVIMVVHHYSVDHSINESLRTLQKGYYYTAQHDKDDQEPLYERARQDIGIPDAKNKPI